jgi:succinate-acetate transporter protein
VPEAAGGAGKLVAAAVMTLATVRFTATGIPELSGSEAWKHTAGVIGLVLVAAASALAVEDQQRRALLPTGGGARGAEAFGGDWGPGPSRPR